MADRFSLLPYEIQDYIHKLALNEMLKTLYFKKVNQIESGVLAVLEIMGNRNKYWKGWSDFDWRSHPALVVNLRNDYVLNALKYISKTIRWQYIDQVWWSDFIFECNHSLAFDNIIEGRYEYQEARVYIETIETRMQAN